MRRILRDFYRDIASRKSFWVPLVFLTYGTFGFSMLQRTVGADDLATGLYVDGTLWLQELRWGAVLWKKIFSFGEYVPFADKYLSVCLLMIDAALFAAILYVLSGRRRWVWLYTLPACGFITYAVLQEVWEFTCGATIVVPGSYLLTFLALLYLLTRDRPTLRSTLTAGVLLAFVTSAAESLAPVYVSMVLLILFYKYCVREPGPEADDCVTRRFPGRAGWFFEGLSCAAPLAIGLVLRLIVGYAIMGILHLQFQHTGATKIYWPLSGEQLRTLICEFLVNYVAAGLVYLPIGVFVGCAVLFAAYAIRLCVKRRSALPLFLGFCSGLSLFFLMLIQAMVMWYRTAITLMVFTGFCVFLAMELLGRVLDPAVSPESAAFRAAREADMDGDRERAASLRPRGALPALRRYLCLAAAACLLLLCWRQGIYENKLLALNNQRSENEAAYMQQIGLKLVSEYEKKPLVFAGNYDLGHNVWVQTTVAGDSLRERLFYKIRHKLTGKGSGKPFNYVQTDASSAVDWYNRQFKGQLMGAYLAYWGYDYEVISGLSDKEYHKYLDLAAERNMTSGQIIDMGDYLLICIGRLNY